MRSRPGSAPPEPARQTPRTRHCWPSPPPNSRSSRGIRHRTLPKTRNRHRLPDRLPRRRLHRPPGTPRPGHKIRGAHEMATFFATKPGRPPRPGQRRPQQPSGPTTAPQWLKMTRPVSCTITVHALNEALSTATYSALTSVASRGRSRRAPASTSAGRPRGSPAMSSACGHGPHVETRDPRRSHDHQSTTARRRHRDLAAPPRRVARPREAATRELDAIAAQRRRMPMVKLPEYTLEGEEGPVTLAEIFDGRPN